MLVFCNYWVGDSLVVVELVFEKMGLMGLMFCLVG